jgi:uncharacterized protein (DUF58 family)
MTTFIHPGLDDLVRLQFEARGFSLLPRQPVSSLLSGRHASRLRGRGLTFEELRGYRPGDDIRAMDWRATARLRKPHVRVYTEERERPVLLVVDQRSSMFFGSARTTKATAAAELAALAAWRTLDAGDRVGAIIFNDDDAIEIRPHRSRSNVLRICHELVSVNQRQTASQRPRRTLTASLNDALRRAVGVAKHDHLVVVISDLAGDDDITRKHATYLVAHNDVLAVLVYDPLGIRISGHGQTTATDGRQQLLVPEGEQFAEQFQLQFEARCEQIRQRLRSLRIPILPICTHENVTSQVLSALGSHR